MQTTKYQSARIAAALLILHVLAAGAASIAAPPADVPADHAARAKQGLALFRDRVAPLLTEHCLKCHGGESVKADFNLATRESLADSGMVDEEDPSYSYLLDLVRHEAEPGMPLNEEKLSEEEIAVLEEWIGLGFPYDRPLAEGIAEQAEMQVTDADRNFWSFQPLSDPPVPDVSAEQQASARTPVDRFVLRKLAEQGLATNPPAERRVLIRRLYLDVLGLPPTPREVARFVSDPAPDAYARLVDRVLASPHYGERWARHWMDVARYAESFGYEQDYNRPYAYTYRDFLIRAFNEDLPYDEFVRWQIAGDGLVPANGLALAATGFLAAGVFPTQLTEKEFESARYDELDDMVATTGVAFLGLSIGCARCHDHKFDPIPARDYYRLAATFTDTIRSEIRFNRVTGEVRPVELPEQPQPAELPEREGIGPNEVVMLVAGDDWPKLPHHADGRGFEHVLAETHVLRRGDVNQKVEVAKPGVLTVLSRETGDRSSGAGIFSITGNDRATSTPAPGADAATPEEPSPRRDLADWLTDTRQATGPLAARVIVNRLWQHHFGRGVVATPNDFGLQGDPPTHPELLDWLAGELVRADWSLKHIHRLILNSAVYRQSSDISSRQQSVDPENLWLSRWTIRRLEAEPIRDSLFAVGGKLDRRMYGRGTLDPLMPRRAVYFFLKRSELIPSLMLFDWPEHQVSLGRRASTTIGPQALLFMNSDEGRLCAAGFAERLPAESPEASIRRAYALAFSRPAEPEEIAAGRRFLTQQKRRYAADGHERPRPAALIDFCQALLASNEFIFIE